MKRVLAVLAAAVVVAVFGFAAPANAATASLSGTLSGIGVWTKGSNVRYSSTGAVEILVSSLPGCCLDLVITDSSSGSADSQVWGRVSNVQSDSLNEWFNMSNCTNWFTGDQPNRSQQGLCSLPAHGAGYFRIWFRNNVSTSDLTWTGSLQY